MYQIPHTTTVVPPQEVKVHLPDIHLPEHPDRHPWLTVLLASLVGLQLIADL